MRFVIGITERRSVMKTIALPLLFAAACAGFAPAALAQSKPAPTKFYVTVDGHLSSASGGQPSATLTFSEPVQVPKADLPAGSYLFTMVSPSIVRVTSEDGRKVFTTFNTTTATRNRDLKHPQVRFERATAGAPLRLIGIYMEGSGSGYAPIYKRVHREPGAALATSGTVGEK